jgi:hypothetical protein
MQRYIIYNFTFIAATEDIIIKICVILKTFSNTKISVKRLGIVGKMYFR